MKTTGIMYCASICVSVCLNVFVCVAPSVLRERGWHPERQQPDHCVYRRQDVLLESGHAFPATGKQHGTTHSSLFTQPATTCVFNVSKHK